MSKAQILPRNVSTSSEAFAHPDALVKDIVQDGDEVFVESLATLGEETYALDSSAAAGRCSGARSSLQLSQNFWTGTARPSLISSSENSFLM